MTIMKEQEMSIEQVRAMIKGMRTELEELEKALNEFWKRKRNGSFRRVTIRS